MPLERVPASGAYLEVLERVMDKGIVIDAEVRISVIGLEVLRIDAQVVIASIETYVTTGDVIERLTSPSGSGGVEWKIRRWNPIQIRIHESPEDGQIGADRRR